MEKRQDIQASFLDLDSSSDREKSREEILIQPVSLFGCQREEEREERKEETRKEYE